MLCIIANYNLDEKARELQSSFQHLCETMVVDSSGVKKYGFIGVASGLNFKKSCELFIASQHERCLFICSDIIVSNSELLICRIEGLNKNVGLYTPAVFGKSHDFLKHETPGLKAIPFCEGMILCANREIIAELLRRDVIEKTYLGWGIDIYKGYICKELGYDCVVDGSVSVFHPQSRSYKTSRGKAAMTKFVSLVGSDFRRFCNNAGFDLSFYARWYRKLLLLTKVSGNKFYK